MMMASLSDDTSFPSLPSHKNNPTTRRISVLTTREWRQQSREETHAATLGLPPDEPEIGSGTAQSSTIDKVLVAWAMCDTCGIGIGPDHYEQELYLYPIRNGGTYLRDESWQEYKYRWLLICGECARRPKRNLHESFCLLSRDHWETTLLLEGETRTARMDDAGEMSAIRLAADQYLLARYRYYVFLTLVAYHLPVYLVFLTPEEERHSLKDRLSLITKRVDRRLSALRSPVPMTTPTPMTPSSTQQQTRRSSLRLSLIHMMDQVDAAQKDTKEQKGHETA